MATATHAVAEVAALSAAAAASTGYTLLSFTPATAALGGLLLGLATAGKLLSTGRVLGISGAVKGLIAGDAAPWRFAFLLGLALGSVALTGLLPGAFEALPASFPVWRVSLSGLLVGLGSALGNGCTSGHGICGSARLSIRSFAYTGMFMAAGMATATLTGTAAALQVAPLPAALLMPTTVELQLAATVAASGVASFAALAVAARALRPAPAPVTPTAGSSTINSVTDLAAAADSSAQQPQPLTLELGSELVAGVIFALGLGLSGMMHPSKVAGFLSVTSPAWDLSLPFVMGGAVLVAMVAYQGVLRFKMMPKPLFCSRFSIPTSSAIDARLLAGGLLFGAGWGLAGLCPGPALVSALQADPHVLTFVGSMVCGMWLEGRMSAWAAANAGRPAIRRTDSQMQ